AAILWTIAIFGSLIIRFVSDHREAAAHKLQQFAVVQEELGPARLSETLVASNVVILSAAKDPSASPQNNKRAAILWTIAILGSLIIRAS
ncbi:MAG: hypothetical protein Q8K85_21010, partial [Hyphomicrobium sp.]|nr:hypothetical protein [Hyphomicrobium sp.]